MTWLGRADDGRVALVDRGMTFGPRALRLAGPVAVAVVWVRPLATLDNRLAYLYAGVLAVPSELGFWFDRVLVLTNLDGREAQRALAQWFGEVKRFVVLGARELGKSLDRHPQLRAAMPSVLGLRDLDPLIDADTRARASFDIGAAQELARVFWPTRAYHRARAVLGRHRFVVLTGPPEMGKTAIARMLALAQVTDGWEAHECTSPDQVWRAYERDRAQVFVADDAFGSTEYRSDAAELWARELARMLQVLDDHHWLIWTSRPAPLKAGLRRVHREQGSERFPAPGEVLVDAGELDLAEKTLILFRHAKNRHADHEACALLRSAGVSIVEHPHFTPERILEDEHRALLIALLDAPAGLIDERELVATTRRHHPGGLRRPPRELIDRLTDHFLRSTPLGIGWVHPSWRDLVIGELAADPIARRAFISACGIYGVTLAISLQGGPAGDRRLPLLIDDRDWDTLGDRIGELVRELEDQDLARLLLALADSVRAPLPPDQHSEAACLTQYVLGATRRAWDKPPRSLPVFLLEAWYGANAAVPEPCAAPPVAPTWAELRPSRDLLVAGLRPRDLQALDDWLTLAQVLATHDPQALHGLGFYDHDQKLIAHATVELGAIDDPELRQLAETILRRIRALSPTYRDLARTTLTQLRAEPAESRWWVPRDIESPPSTEPVAHERIGFTREDVERVLADL